MYSHIYSPSRAHSHSCTLRYSFVHTHLHSQSCTYTLTPFHIRIVPSIHTHIHSQVVTLMHIHTLIRALSHTEAVAKKASVEFLLRETADGTGCPRHPGSPAQHLGHIPCHLASEPRVDEKGVVWRGESHLVANRATCTPATLLFLLWQGGRPQPGPSLAIRHCCPGAQ